MTGRLCCMPDQAGPRPFQKSTRNTRLTLAEFTQEKIPVRELAEGMYVSSLDRPWVGTPFPLQGFYIRNEDDIRRLHQYCEFVTVDTLKSRVPIKGRLAVPVRRYLPAAQGRTVISGRKSSAPACSLDKGRLVRDPKVYRRTRPLKQELDQASKLHGDISKAVDEVMDKLAAGRPTTLRSTRKIAGRMVDSIARNPDAFVWIARIRDKDEYTYSHCVRSSVWAITFGRHLGLKKNSLENLALGVLLSDIGKTEIPESLLIRDDILSESEYEMLKKHVEYGVGILSNCKGINDEVISVVMTCHEKYNGTGYPRGLKGDQIPLLGRIAGIVDFYDAVTCPRKAEAALSPSEAMIRLHHIRGDEFQEELVDEFIQAIGIYPTGSLVELSSGEVGVITEQNEARRLRPRVLLILDRHKQPLKKQQEIDLMQTLEDRNGERLNITSCLPEGSYGIDLSAYRRNFIERFLGLGNPLFHH